MSFRVENEFIEMCTHTLYKVLLLFCSQEEITMCSEELWPL